MSGEPLRGPSMIFFSEGVVVKIFFLGGGVVKEGVGVMCFLDLAWSCEPSLGATLLLCMLQVKITYFR